MAGYSKLFSDLLGSTVWGEDYATRIVWISMLAATDATGYVAGSIPGFARIANVTVIEMRHAVDRLSAPDPDSRTLDFEGRRIQEVQGGWMILNYAAYRARGQSKDGSRAISQKQHRDRKRGAA